MLQPARPASSSGRCTTPCRPAPGPRRGSSARRCGARLGSGRRQATRCRRIFRAPPAALVRIRRRCGLDVRRRRIERAVSDCPSTGLSGVGAGDAGSDATAAGAVSAERSLPPAVAQRWRPPSTARRASARPGRSRWARRATAAPAPGQPRRSPARWVSAQPARSGAGCGAALLSGTGVAAGAAISAGGVPSCADTRRFASSDIQPT